MKNSRQPKAKIINEKHIASCFDIDIKEASLILKGMERLSFDNNQDIVTIGDDADGMFFIEDGQTVVLNNEGEEVNELFAGHYFGEYAIITGEKRLTTVKAKGHVVAYKMNSEDFLDLIGRHPKITGRMLKQAYSQVSDKHAKIESLTRKSRGVMWSPEKQKDVKPADILATYGVALLFFIVVAIMAPKMTNSDQLPIWWQLLPMFFLMAFTLKTRRIVEGMILTLLLMAGMLNKGHFITGFGSMLVVGIGNEDTGKTITIMAMVEIVAALMAASGVVSAFRKIAEKRIKTRSGSMFAMLGIMLLVCIDECLNVITAAFCLNDISDKLKIPREKRALLGSFSVAICSIIPFSLWGAYICGWIAMYCKDGGTVFLRSIPYNMVGILVLVFALLLCIGILPQNKQLKLAQKRVDRGGKPWPNGSEKYFGDVSDDKVVGNVINLILPMVVLILATIISGTIQNGGTFSLDAVSGLIITLIFMYVFYIGRRLFTPKHYFETLADGIANALMPILVLVLSERISECMIDLGLISLLEKGILGVIGDAVFLVPVIIYLLTAVICVMLGSNWGAYGIAIPISVILSRSIGGDVALYLGAALAGGLIGEGLCPYLDETSPVVTSIGCGVIPYRKIRFAYWIPLAVLAAVGYVLIGLFKC